MADYLRAPTGCAAITLSNTGTNSGGPFRALWINAAGNINVQFTDETNGVFTVAAGTRFEGSIKRVNITSTTVLTTDIIGLK